VKDKIEGKELMVICIAVQVEERKVADDRNDCRREGQKDKRKGVPMHDEWPAKEAEGFDLHRNLTKSQEIQGNRNVNKITDVSPVYQFTHQVLLTFLLIGKILDVDKKYLDNWEQYKVMHKIGN
jgi:hypothetical protein